MKQFHVIHCSATREGQDVNIQTVRRWHLKRGWRDVGYHFFVRLDGTLEYGRPLEQNGAHVRDHNVDTVGICYAGGLDANGKPKDTLTPQQEDTIRRLLDSLHIVLGRLPVYGHRDLSPDRDGDGIIEPSEWLKACPCFDVIEKFGADLTNRDPNRFEPVKS